MNVERIVPFEGDHISTANYHTKLPVLNMNKISNIKKYGTMVKTKTETLYKRKIGIPCRIAVTSSTAHDDSF